MKYIFRSANFRRKIDFKVSGSGNRGASIVEFAVIFPIFLVLILALVDFARIGFVQLSVTSASREGARYSSLATSGISDLAAFKDFVRSTAPRAARVSQLQSTSILDVDLTKNCTATPLDDTSVKVSTSFTWILPIGLIPLIGDSSATFSPSNLTISATAFMRCAN